MQTTVPVYVGCRLAALVSSRIVKMSRNEEGGKPVR
jgi:hypothetical protein